MTWAQYGLVQATDYNTMVGTDPTTTANVLNTVWATGGTAAGYGQTPLATVAAGQVVGATEWGNVTALTGLMGKTANCGTHQGSSLASVTSAVAGGSVIYQSGIQTNLNTIYTNKLNAASQGTSSPTVVTRSGTWNNQLTFTFSAGFASGDETRYFFNSGGQLKFTFSHPSGSTIDNSLNALATACGTIVLSAPTSGAATIATVSYNGVTKIGGSGSPANLATNNGYYTWSTANTLAFKQLVTSAPAGYVNTNINLNVRTTGTIGSHGDVGNVINIYVQFAELTSTGLTAATGTAVTMAIVPPESTNIANTWHTITPSGSVAGS